MRIEAATVPARSATFVAEGAAESGEEGVRRWVLRQGVRRRCRGGRRGGRSRTGRSPAGRSPAAPRTARPRWWITAATLRNSSRWFTSPIGRQSGASSPRDSSAQPLESTRRSPSARAASSTLFVTLSRARPLPNPQYRGGSPASRNLVGSPESGRVSGSSQAPVWTTAGPDGWSGHGAGTGSAAGRPPASYDDVAALRRRADRLEPRRDHAPEDPASLLGGEDGPGALPGSSGPTGIYVTPSGSAPRSAGRPRPLLRRQTDEQHSGRTRQRHPQSVPVPERGAAGRGGRVQDLRMDLTARHMPYR